MLFRARSASRMHRVPGWTAPNDDRRTVMRLARGAVLLRIRQTLLLVSLLLCLMTTAVSRTRWAWSTAFILLPLWIWLLPGLVLAALGWSRATKRWCIAVVALWFLFVLFFCEESRSLLRADPESASENETARKAGQSLRIVSLNCAGMEQAAAEVGAYNPDIVFLQESPGRSRSEEHT